MLPIVKSPTTVETGPMPPEPSRGPGVKREFPPLSRIATSLEPSSATTRSGKAPVRLATVIPAGLVPTK